MQLYVIGTEPASLIEWMTDATLDQIDYPRQHEDVTQAGHQIIKVHRGFASALGIQPNNTGAPLRPGCILEQIADLIQPYRARNSQLVITCTGHSLGAALGQLAAYSLKLLLNVPVTAVYTYGTPVVGNAAYADDVKTKFNIRRIRCIINHNDIVPRIPISTVDAAYAHVLGVVAAEAALQYQPVGTQVYLNRDHISVLGNNIIQPMELADEIDPLRTYIRQEQGRPNISRMRRWLWRMMPTYVSDHFPGDYCRNLRYAFQHTPQQP